VAFKKEVKMESAEIMNLVKKEIRKSLGMRIQATTVISNDSDLRSEFGLDSIDEVEVIAKLEKRFNIEIGVDKHFESPQEYYNIITEKLYTIPKGAEMKKGIFAWFANKSSEKNSKKGEELDEKQNEMMILQMILFTHAVNYDALHDIIKSSFCVDVPKDKLENVRSVEALYHTMKKYGEKRR